MLDKKFFVYGYLGNWEHPEGWNIDKIDWDVLTHIIDSFAYPTDNGEIDFSHLRKKRLIEKAHSKGVKCMFSIGGGNLKWAEKFSNISKEKKLRENFIDNIINFLMENGYDGVDIDWEFPTKDDRENFINLIKELNEKLKKYKSEYFNTPMELTFFAGSMYHSFGFYLEEIHKYVDFMILGGYDIGDGKKLKYNAPLRNKDKNFITETGEKYEPSISGYIDFVLKKGFPEEKIIIALPFYALPEGKEYGWIKSNCDFVEYNRLHAESVYKERNSQNIYYVNDVISFKDKLKFIKNKNIRGIAIWEVSQIYPENDLWEIIKIFNKTYVKEYTR